MPGLANIADDLGAFLREAAPEFKRAQTRTLTAEQADALAGGVLDYVFAKAEPGDSSANLGEAAVVGALAAAHDFGFDDAGVAVALVERLERMAAAARSALTEMSTPSSAHKKILDAVKRLSSSKHVSAKMVATESGTKLKPAIVALNKLQAAGFVDYNLKSGYSVMR